MERLEAMREIGLGEWEKNNTHRFYVNDVSNRLGLETSRYNTGNISHATLNGEKISNTKAAKLLSRCADTKIWWDVPTGKWQVKKSALGLTQEEISTVIDSIEAQIVELVEA